MSWTTIRTGMKTRLATISTLAAHDVVPAKSTDNDVAYVLPAAGTMREKGMHDGDWYYVRVVVQCQRGALDDQQRALDVYLSPTGASSIEAAIYGDATLGGSVENTEFLSVSNYGMAENGYMQADVNFRCLVVV